MYSWGTGRSGELGHEHLTRDNICPLPQPAKNPTGIKACAMTAVSACEGCSAAITADGRLLTCGMSYKAGHGSDDGTQPVLKPVAALGGLRVMQVSCGEYHCGCVTDGASGGQVFLWGKSEAGCVGDGDASTHKVLVPRRLQLAYSGSNACNAPDPSSGNAALLCECGYRTTLVLTSDGSVLTWGSGSGGRLGHGDTTDRIAPTVVTTLLGQRCVAASMGSCHTAVVTSAGLLFTFGMGILGCLGHGDERSHTTPKQVQGLPAIVSVSCTKGMVNPVQSPGQCGPHTLAVAQDGSLWSWGSGHKGKLGNLQAKWGFHLKGVEDSRTPYCVGGPSVDGDCKPTGYLEGVHVVGAVASALHSAVWDDVGRLYTFGCGSDGRMGLKAYLKGSGQGRQRMKFYVSAPSLVDALQETQQQRVVGAAASRRHMVAALQPA